ncbi:MAG: NAD-dependent epimerase/dehydratase family protein, partial [Deltaproteobacteria bacterium]|nr:NAD-dependent epimerase/dehydratase family protein [Nannocystaceae bacterium]
VVGDIRDPELARRATEGAAVVYDCMNPAYHRWPQELLPMGAGALAGAQQAGAKLVALDCLYMYGRVSGPMREDSPLAPCSRKGELRVQLAELRMDASRRGDVSVAIGRASDFFGAGLPNTMFSDRFFERILAGKPGECFGNPDLPHAFSYADDVARGLLTLGTHDDAFGKVWHLPTLPAESPRNLVRRLGAALGVAGEVTGVPRWMVRAMGVFSPLMREIVEMQYQYEQPYLLDDSRFVAAFGEVATPIEQQIAEVAAWARGRWPSTAAA